MGQNSPTPVSGTSASCQRGPNGEAPHRTGMERQIASKVIDKTAREGAVPVQLQSLLSSQEISHGQSELAPQRGPLGASETLSNSVFAKKNF